MISFYPVLIELFSVDAHGENNRRVHSFSKFSSCPRALLPSGGGQGASTGVGCSPPQLFPGHKNMVLMTPESRGSFQTMRN